MTVDAVTALNARDEMLWIASQWQQLTAALGGRGGKGLTGMPTAASPEPRLVIDVHVSDLMHQITGVAEFYGTILLAEVAPEHGCGGACQKVKPKPIPAADCPRRVDPITTSTMPGLLVQVASRYGHFVKSDDAMATGFTDDAHEYADKVKRTLNPTSRPTYIGPCQTQNCPGELRLREDHEHARCPDCGTVTTAEAQRMWLEVQLGDRLMTPTEIAAALKTLLNRDVPIKTIRSWINRGQLTEEEGTGLYPLSRARELATRTARTVA